MSLLLRKRLTVALCRDHVAIAEKPRGWRRPAPTPLMLSCSPLDGQPEWAAPLAVLHEWLAQNRQAASLTVVLSDSMARYALIPWTKEVLAGTEKAALTRIHFDQLFGSPSQHWVIKDTPASYGQARIACALDANLLVGLRATALQPGMRVMSLRPYFMCAYNRWRSSIAGYALLVVVEAGQCVMASCRDGAWHSIRSIRLGAAGVAGLALLIERETLLQGLQGAMLYLHTPGLELAAPVAGLEKAVLLQQVAVMPGQPAAVGMALCGLA